MEKIPTNEGQRQSKRKRKHGERGREGRALLLGWTGSLFTLVNQENNICRQTKQKRPKRLSFPPGGADVWPCYANNESIFIDIQINVIWWENRWLQVIGIIDPLPHI